MAYNSIFYEGKNVKKNILEAEEWKSFHYAFPHNEAVSCRDTFVQTYTYCVKEDYRRHFTLGIEQKREEKNDKFHNIFTLPYIECTFFLLPLFHDYKLSLTEKKWNIKAVMI